MKASAPEAARKQSKRGAAATSSSASSWRAKPRRTKKPTTSNLVRQSWGEPLTQHDVDLVEKLLLKSDRSISLKDQPEIKQNAFANRSGILTSGLFKPYKQQVTLRIDGDIIAWARRDGAGYQSRINAALRKAMMEDLKSSGATNC